MINGVVRQSVAQWTSSACYRIFIVALAINHFEKWPDERRYHRWPLLSEVGCNATRPHTVCTVRQ